MCACSLVTTFEDQASIAFIQIYQILFWSYFFIKYCVIIPPFCLYEKNRIIFAESKNTVKSLQVVAQSKKKIVWL